jgi:cysteine desulfurase/selenocysteine lyase
MLHAETRRRDFPSLEQMRYFNTAAEGIPPLSVRDALLQYFADKQLGMDGRPLHAAQWEAVRQLTASFFGLTAEEIGICSCASEAYNLAALALQLREGDEVVINDLDFPAGATPWLQESCPATTKLWRSRGGALRVEDLVPLLGPKTRFVRRRW